MSASSNDTPSSSNSAPSMSAAGSAVRSSSVERSPETNVPSQGTLQSVADHDSLPGSTRSAFGSPTSMPLGQNLLADHRRESGLASNTATTSQVSLFASQLSNPSTFDQSTPPDSTHYVLFFPVEYTSESNAKLRFCHICCMDVFKGFSAEEVRLADYERGKKPATFTKITSQPPLLPAKSAKPFVFGQSGGAAKSAPSEQPAVSPDSPDTKKQEQTKTNTSHSAVERAVQLVVDRHRPDCKQPCRSLFDEYKNRVWSETRRHTGKHSYPIIPDLETQPVFFSDLTILNARAGYLDWRDSEPVRDLGLIIEHNSPAAWTCCGRAPRNPGCIHY